MKILFVVLFSFLLLQNTTVFGQTGSRIQDIVIDPGHGGTDPGNLGTRTFKTTEKHIVLKVSLLYGKMLKKRMKGLNVHFTRTNDTYPKLWERAKMANDLKADLFVSIHCDAHHTKSPKGSTTIVLGTGHNERNRIAIQENGLLLKQEGEEEIESVFETSQDGKYMSGIYRDMFLQQSVDFGDRIQKQFREQVQRIDRGVKHQALEVIRKVTMPAVLVELGFLTNPEEERFLNSSIGQKMMAEALCDATIEYIEHYNAIWDAAHGVDTSKLYNGRSLAGGPSDKTFFGVQILSGTNIISEFKSLHPVHVHEEGGLKKYIFGYTKNYLHAIDLLKIAKDKGYKQAFVVGFIEGKKVSSTELKGHLLRNE